MATHPALAYLHEVRAGARGAKHRSAWFAAYACALIGGAWGLPLLLAASQSGGDGARGGALGARVLDALPLLAPAALLLALLLMGYGATWRGPVTVERPALTWLLLTPLARGPVVLPRLLAALGLAVTGGAIAGGVAGFLLSALRGAPWAGATAAGGWAGLCTALVGGALGIAVERHEPLLLRRGPGVLRAAIAALCAGGALGVACGVPSWFGTVCLWSGPWGWAAQPLVAAVDGPAPGWRAAVALAAGCAALAVWAARRAAPLVPLAVLRRRATVAAQVTAALFALDLRQARGAVRPLGTPGARPAPPPLAAHPLARRDRPAPRPARLAWAALWTAASVALTAHAPTARGSSPSRARPSRATRPRPNSPSPRASRPTTPVAPRRCPPPRAPSPCGTRSCRAPRCWPVRARAPCSARWPASGSPDSRCWSRRFRHTWRRRWSARTGGLCRRTC